jgi:hypothetical protein
MELRISVNLESGTVQVSLICSLDNNDTNLLMSMSPCPHVPMSPCPYVPMSPCLHVPMSLCLHVSMSPCLHISIPPCLHISMSLYLHALCPCLHAHASMSMDTNTNTYLHIVAIPWFFSSQLPLSQKIHKFKRRYHKFAPVLENDPIM